MTPFELDLVLNGARIYAHPDGSRYATCSDSSRFGVKPIGRSGPLSKADLLRPASEILAEINAKLEIA